MMLDSGRSHEGSAGAERSPPELSALEIVAAVRHDEEGEALARELRRTRARVHHLWPLPPRLPEGVDAIFCELTAQLPSCLPWIPGQPTAALVAVMSAVQAPDLKLLRNCAPHAVLHRPFTPNTVLTSLALARAQFLYERRLRSRIDKLDETLRAFRSVERAKTILMQTHKLGEDEAYHFIRRHAMNRRISISAVAAAIVDSKDVLG